MVFTLESRKAFEWWLLVVGVPSWSPTLLTACVDSSFTNTASWGRGALLPKTTGIAPWFQKHYWMLVSTLGLPTMLAGCVDSSLPKYCGYVVLALHSPTRLARGVDPWFSTLVLILNTGGVDPWFSTLVVSAVSNFHLNKLEKELNIRDREGNWKVGYLLFRPVKKRYRKFICNISCHTDRNHCLWSQSSVICYDISPVASLSILNVTSVSYSYGI